jgi:uncharacterized protein with beta-barrel porin domain
MQSNFLLYRHSFLVYACCVLVSFITPSPLLAQPAPLPTSFDLRDVDGKNYLSPVKDQGRLGTCYSFAATAAAEGTYNRAMDLHGEDAISLSESFIVWSLGPYYDGFPAGSYGGGGYAWKDELQALVDYGTCREEDFPYMGTKAEAEPYENDINRSLDYHWDAPRIQFSGWHRLPANDIESIKRAISTFGTVDTSVFVGDEFRDYTSGIFSDDRTVADYPIEYFPGNNHAIALVGWDDNSTGEGIGSWVLRNSWSEDWGEDGYMRIAYTSGRVAVSACYLTYGDWNDYGFANTEFTNTGTINGELNATGYQPVARGWYEWGDDTSFMINNGTITANGTVDSGDPYVHGMFLWAGNASRIENNEILSATASTNAGQATAYGACLQGHALTNTGTISVNASSDDDRATAYGVRFFSFDANGVFNNSGSITARAESDDGWAYALFSSNAHTVDNSGNMTAIGNGNAVAILSDGATTTTNHGRLVANSTQGNAYGMNIFQGTARNKGDIISQSQGIGAHAYGISADTTSLDKSTLDIANTKTIDVQATGTNGTAYGISSWGAKSIFNSGSITATAGRTSFGIASCSDTRLSNAGTITATATATNGTACGIKAKGTATIINKGTVNATAAHTAYGVDLTNSTFINNSGGTIVASTSNGTVRTLNLMDARATNEGTITATGPGGEVYAVYLTESTLFNDGSVNGNTFVGEKSILGGNGSFTGDVINDSGTVAPGNSIGTLTIIGDYVQRTDGTLEIEFDNVASDRLNISNKADIQGGILKLVPLGYTTGGSHLFLNAANGITGTFDQIVSPAVFKANLTGGTLALSRNTYTSLGANDGQRGVGTALEAIRPMATGDMNTILNGLDTMQLAPLQNALDDMTPGMHAAAGYAALQNTHRSMGYVRRHWKDLQTESMRTDTPYEASAGSENGTRFNAWGSFLGASSRAKSQDVIPGCNESMTGLVLGLDYRIGDNLTTGLAGSYTTQSLDQEDGSGSSTIKTFRGYVYGLWDENSEAKGWYIATALGMGAIRFDTDRDLAFLGREAKSDHSAQDYSLLATTGYDMETGNWTIRPSLNLEYIFLHEEGYDESHAGDMNLHIGSHDAHSLQSALGVSIARRCRMKQAVIIPELRLAWTHEFLPEQDDLTSRFLAAGPSFDTPARDIPKDAAVLGLAVKAPLSDMVFAAIDYECTLTEANESTDHRFNAQLRIRF